MKIPWNKLLRSIHNQQVLPILGANLTLIQEDDKKLPLKQWLIPQLIDRLDIQDPHTHSLNHLAGNYLMQGGNRADFYDEIREIIDDLLDDRSYTLPENLKKLAQITDFDLFITASFDPFLSLALEQERPGFNPKKGSAEFHPCHPVDLPNPLPNSFLYHILGSFNTYPDFAVWEEDYMEFICGLLESPKDTRRHLFTELRNRSLLLIGSPFDDWIVRFFLRIAKGERLSNRTHNTSDYIAEHGDNIHQPLVFFFDKVLKCPRIIETDPSQFIDELNQRWKEKFLASSSADFLHSLSDEIELGTIFISYSHDDLDATIELASGLRSAGLPVWLDKNRLTAGSDWENHLLRAVKVRSSLFISLISRSTEAAPERFVHKERQWAAEKHIPGNIFYIPVIIDDTPTPPTQEPKVFNNLQCYNLKQGKVTAEFIQTLQKYHNTWKEKGEITDV